MNVKNLRIVALWACMAAFITALMFASAPASSALAGNAQQEATSTPIGGDGEVQPGQTVVPPTAKPVGTAKPGELGGPPPSLNELIVANPQLKPYLEKVGKLTKDKIDLAEFYATLIGIYKKSGAQGVGIFLKDSGLLETLGIPVDFLALFTAYDKDGKGNLDEAIKAAKELKLVDAKDEFVGLLTLDDAKNLDSVKKALVGEGISVYEFNERLLSLRIGIPIKVLKQFQTPASLLTFLIDIPSIPHVVGFTLPKPVEDVG